MYEKAGALDVQYNIRKENLWVQEMESHMLVRAFAKRSREHLSKAPDPWEEKWKENGSLQATVRKNNADTFPASFIVELRVFPKYWFVNTSRCSICIFKQQTVYSCYSFNNQEMNHCGRWWGGAGCKCVSVKAFWTCSDIVKWCFTFQMDFLLSYLENLSKFLWPMLYEFA